jgi:hypothetical protein
MTIRKRDWDRLTLDQRLGHGGESGVGPDERALLEQAASGRARREALRLLADLYEDRGRSELALACRWCAARRLHPAEDRGGPWWHDYTPLLALTHDAPGVCRAGGPCAGPALGAAPVRLPRSARLPLPVYCATVEALMARGPGRAQVLSEGLVYFFTWRRALAALGRGLLLLRDLAIPRGEST